LDTGKLIAFLFSLPSKTSHIPIAYWSGVCLKLLSWWRWFYQTSRRTETLLE